MRSALVILAFFFALGNAVCPDQNLPELPEAPHIRGPWVVGLRTISMTQRNFTVDILYPAAPGSEIGKSYVIYSLRDNYMPPRQAAKIPDEDDPLQTVEAYRDLPIDTHYGPYPVHIHIHGTASFRSASDKQLTHFASRGFVVLAADHPGLNLGDMIRLGGGQQVDLVGDVEGMIDELKTFSNPEVSFLRGHIEIERLAISGHSAGGGATGALGNHAQVLMSLASFGVSGGTATKSVLIMGGVEDSIANYDSTVRGYELSPSPKRLVGVADAGHLFCTELCYIGEEDGGIVQIAIDHGIYLAYFLKTLGTDGCDADQVKNQAAWEITNFAMSGAQEEVLMCNPSMAEQLRRIDQIVPHVYEYREALD